MSFPKIINYSWLICLLGMGLFPALLAAQDDEDEGPLSSRTSLSCLQKDDGTIDLNALMRARIDRRYTPLPGLEVEFFATTDSSEVSLGKATTKDNGIATLTIKPDNVPKDTSGRMYLMAQFPGNDEFSDSDDDIEILPARIVLEPIEEDSSRAMQITLLSGDEAVPDEDVSLFVNRMFSRLKVGEATTDEDGTATINVPMDLPGDAEGKLEIIALLEDHDDFGSVRSIMTPAWGDPVSDLSEKLPRALWSPYPPMWMIITFLVLMVAVWGHYVIIFLKLQKVKKEGKAVENG